MNNASSKRLQKEHISLLEIVKATDTKLETEVGRRSIRKIRLWNNRNDTENYYIDNIFLSLDLFQSLRWSNQRTKIEDSHRSNFCRNYEHHSDNLNDNQNDICSTYQRTRRRHLSTIFLSLAASRLDVSNTITPNSSFEDKNKDSKFTSLNASENFQSQQDAALKDYKYIERKLLEKIHLIGQIVINSERVSSQRKSPRIPSVSTNNNLTKDSLRSDEVFEYFCENNVLRLLVDIASTNPPSKTNKVATKDRPIFSGVVWSPRVKGQVYKTVGTLISSVRDPTGLYYILSQNFVNNLISSIFPLQQYTYEALEIMLPPYVHLLKSLSFQLSSSPETVFPFCTILEDRIQNKKSMTATKFPLFTAIVGVLTSTYSRSNSFVHASCLNLLVGLMQVSNPTLQTWIDDCAETEQNQIADHFCFLLVDSYNRLSNLMVGPVVDVVRSKALETQLDSFKRRVYVLNDIFCCNHPSLNMKLCENIVRNFVFGCLLRDILPSNERRFLSVGASDLDVLPDMESSAQVAVLLLARLLNTVEYAPFARMIAIAVFHPYSTETLSIRINNGPPLENEFGYTLELNTVVMQGIISVEDTNKSSNLPLVRNPYRSQVISAVSGTYGEWRVISAAFLVESALLCPYLDCETLVKIGLLNVDPPGTLPAITDAVVTFMKQELVPKSAIAAISLECVSSLAIRMLYKSTQHLSFLGFSANRIQKTLLNSSLYEVLQSSRLFYVRKMFQSSQSADFFVDLIDSVIEASYKKVEQKNLDNTTKIDFVYQLNQHCCSFYQYNTNLDYLVRKVRGVNWNEIEYIRYYSQMAIHFRALCNIIDNFIRDLARIQPAVDQDSTIPTVTIPVLNENDSAGELCSFSGSLRKTLSAGTQVDLAGRMTFPFHTTPSGNTSNFHSTNYFILVLDPFDMIVVVPESLDRRNIRGDVLCSIPLVNVIAAATDGGNLLHVAVRYENVDYLIKNGNMMFKFDANGTSFIVKEYLDRTRSELRKNMLEQIRSLFSIEERKKGPVAESRTCVKNIEGHNAHL